MTLPQLHKDCSTFSQYSTSHLPLPLFNICQFHQWQWRIRHFWWARDTTGNRSKHPHCSEVRDSDLKSFSDALHVNMTWPASANCILLCITATLSFQSYLRARVIAVGLVCVRVRVFVFEQVSCEPRLLWIPKVDKWVGTKGVQHSKSLERYCWRTACFRAVRYCIRWALIRDRHHNHHLRMALYSRHAKWLASRGLGPLLTQRPALDF